MIDARAGHVLGIASVAGLEPGWMPYHSAYSSAKQGVIGMMFNLRHELAEFGVGSSLLIPSAVITSGGKNMAHYRPEQFGGPGFELELRAPDVIKDLFIEHQYVFRPAEEVARMVIRGISENRPIIVTGAYDRKIFEETYVAPIMQAFDEVEEFDRTLGGEGSAGLTLDQIEAGWAR
jgi:short-subunit dehydrogenase